MERREIDSHYAWIVVFAAFASHVITHGIIYSFGLLFLALEERFPEASTAEIAWIPSMTSGALHLIGPIASTLVNRYGFEKVTIFGATISALGFAVSGYVDNIYFVYFSMGILAGCGFGLVFLSAVLIVTCYFDKYRSLACSLALSGAGGGAFIFNPLIAKILQTYSLQGTLLLLAAVILNCIPCGLLFKSVHDNNSHASMDVDETTYQNIEAHLVQGPTFIKCNTCNGDFYDISDNESAQFVRCKTCRTFPLQKELCLHHNDTGHGKINGSVVIETEHNDILHGKQVKTMYYQEPGLEIPQQVDNFMHIHKTEGGFRRQLKLLKHPITSLFFTAQFMFLIGFYLPFIYIPDKAINEGIDESRVAWVASTIGLSSIAGRVILGYVADLPSVDRVLLYKMIVLISGVSTLSGPFLNSFVLLIVYALIYGFFTGSYISLTSVVLMDFVGVEIVGDALGMNNLFSGFGCLLGPPFAGFLFDLTRSYDVVFIVPGLSLVLTSAILFVIPCCKTLKT